MAASAGDSRRLGQRRIIDQLFQEVLLQLHQAQQIDLRERYAHIVELIGRLSQKPVRRETSRKSTPDDAAGRSGDGHRGRTAAVRRIRSRLRPALAVRDRPGVMTSAAAGPRRFLPSFRLPGENAAERRKTPQDTALFEVFRRLAEFPRNLRLFSQWEEGRGGVLGGAACPTDKVNVPVTTARQRQEGPPRTSRRRPPRGERSGSNTGGNGAACAI
jgi:hypothetical protein